jgi:hypothetical protein
MDKIHHMPHPAVDQQASFISHPSSAILHHHLLPFAAVLLPGLSDYVRVPANRRIRLCPVAYAPLPNVEQYQAALTLLSGPVDRLSTNIAGKNEGQGEHFQALQNLLHPERVLLAADQIRKVTNSGRRGEALSSTSGSPLSTVNGRSLEEEEEGGRGSNGSNEPQGGLRAPPILPPLQLPQVGATGVQLLQALSGQGPPMQPQLQQDPSKASKVEAGGTAVTAEPPEVRPAVSSKRSMK